jgi:hypothetical protein
MRHIAGKVPTYAEAFSRDLRTRGKHPRQQDRDHLKFIRGLPCLICGSRNTIQAAHIRAGNAVYAKRSTGMGEKSDDRYTLPLCAAHHEEQHGGNELAFWQRYGINDPWRIALSLWSHSSNQDDEAAELVIKFSRTTK